VISVCVVHFKHVTLAHLQAALATVREQDLSHVGEVIVLDNDTADDPRDVVEIVKALAFPVRAYVRTRKHGDPARTHAWSTNAVVQTATQPWIFFTRADYLLARDALSRLWAAAAGDQDCFATGRVYHLAVDLTACERTTWRTDGASVLRALPGKEEDYMAIDAGVWLLSKAAFARVGGLDERLTAWGHAQTHFQHKLHQLGTRFAVVQEPLFFHPRHGGPRDLALATQQLENIGVDVRDLWSRYDGRHPY
jgi:GT2 family glycosyltransferase